MLKIASIVPIWKKLKNSSLTYRSNPRIALNQKIANEYSTFFVYMHMYDFCIKNNPHFSFFLFLLLLRLLLLPFFFFFTNIDKCKTYPDKCHVNALCNNMHGSHVCNANLDILEMDATVQVQSIISGAFIFVLTIIMNFRLLLLVFFLKHARSG